jgi:ASPIC and UnbV/FG-GAP-like repeat/Secretion system C-terminal sorting domain
MKKTFLAASMLLFLGNNFAQTSFSQSQNFIGNQTFHSGVAIGVVDMNGDGRDDLVHLKDGTMLQIEYQNGPNEPFSSFEVGEMSTQSAWALAIGDIDNNGFPDVMTGGSYDGVHIARANADGTAYTIETFAENELFMQAANFCDINGDGWLDLFACHDDGPSRIWGNDGTGQLVPHDDWMPLVLQGGVDENDSGNYGMCWTDIDNDGDWDMYIAKCRQGVNSPSDPRRINILYINNGDGTYTEDGVSRGLAIGAQSWTADFGDIDNDGDMDVFITNHDVKSQILENDGTGHFTDISVASGVSAVPGLPIQGILRDFDNDGFLDIITAGDDESFLHNNGDKTFTAMPNMFDNNTMESYAVGDFNFDGFLDIYGGYGQVYTTPSNIADKIWVNNKNANNYFGLRLIGGISNKSGIHARITVYTPQGKQIREVRGGESYGIQNSLCANFGLGTSTLIDSVTVVWPSGIKDIILNPASNQYLSLNEGGCLLAPVVISAIGSTTICTGQTVQISAPAGFSYVWNTGDTTQTIAAAAAGKYRVQVTSVDGCKTVSNLVTVILDPIEIPTIAAIGDTIFCKGGSVTLQSSIANAYTWSGGVGTNQSVTVSQSGSYVVTTQGLCALFSSAPISVTVLDAPLPVALGDIVAPDSIANLTSTGDEPHWFDAATGGNEVGIGSSFATLPLATTTQFWVENHEIYPGNAFETGQINHAGGQFGSATFNGELIFDAFTPFILEKTKVYTATGGVRHVQILDENGQKLAGKSVNIPVGTTFIDLGFEVPAGTNLRLMTNPDTNTVNFGSIGAKLRRSDSNVAFPYVVPGVVSLTASNFGTDRYYYFYQWQIRTTDRICISDRIQVTATVDPTLDAENLTEKIGFSIFPNPTTGKASFNFDLSNGIETALQIFNLTGQLMFAEKLQLSAGKTIVSRDLHLLGKGVFFVKITTNSGVLSKKLVIE